MIIKTDIIGHDSRIEYLRKILKNDQHSRTLLFTGIPGIGKVLTASYIIAGEICEENSAPCGRCSRCMQLALDTYPDFIRLRPDEDGKIKIGDKNSNEPGTVRWMIRRLTETPASGKYFVLIEDADRISEAGQNALLKTVEEPNPGTTIIMTAVSPKSILQTIRSRTVHIRFAALTKNDIFSVLKQNHAEYDKSLLEFASVAAGGSVQYAEILLNGEKSAKIKELCADIRKSVTENVPTSVSYSQLAKEIIPADLTNLLINIYQYNLESLASKTPYNEYFENLYIDELPIILKLLKILTAMKKIEVYNINKDNAFKAMISAMDETDHGLPFLERLQI